MNETTNPSPSGGFFQWIRNLGIVRDSEDRWFAGVASGLAHKAKIDPLIVRGIFVVLAVLGGPGLLLYLFGWLFLPDRSGKIHAEDLMRGRSTPGVVIGAIFVAVWIIAGITVPWAWSMWPWDLWPFTGAPSGVSTFFAWVFWIAIIAGVTYFGHRAIVQRGNAQRAQADRDGTRPPAASGTVPGEHHESPADPAPDWSSDFSAKAEAWGKDFSDKTATWSKDFTEKTDSWSAEYAEKYEVTRLPRGHLLITLALALLAAGGSALWAMSVNLDARSMLPWSSAGAILIALLAATAVCALSIIVAGARGKRSGPIGFFGFLGVLAILITIAVPWGSRFFLFGDRHIGSEAPGVVSIAGNMTVDLTDFDPRQDDLELVASQGFGNVEVVVPDSRPATITVRVGAGKITSTETTADEALRTVETASGLLTGHTFHVNHRGTGSPLTVTINVVGGNVSLFDTAAYALEGSR